jgi:hypothetical protein
LAPNFIQYLARVPSQPMLAKSQAVAFQPHKHSPSRCWHVGGEMIDWTRPRLWREMGRFLILMPTLQVAIVPCNYNGWAGVAVH